MHLPCGGRCTTLRYLDGETTTYILWRVALLPLEQQYIFEWLYTTPHEIGKPLYHAVHKHGKLGCGVCLI